MFNTADAIPRADISTLLMEAVGQENQYIGQYVFPIYPASVENGRYPKFKKDAGRLLDAAGGTQANGFTKRNDAGTYNETERKFEWDTFQTEEYGLEERVDDTVARRMENYFDAEMITGKMLMNELMLDYEIECANQLLNESNVESMNHASVIWSSVATSDCPADINTAIETMTLRGEAPTDMVLSLKLWNFMRRSTKLQTYLFGTLNTNVGGSMMTTEAVAQAFGLNNVWIARKSYAARKRGVSTLSLTPVWGDTYVALGKFGEGDFMNGGFGRTIIWDADSPGGLFTSESYRAEARRGNILRVRSNRILKRISPAAAHLINVNATS